MASQRERAVSWREAAVDDEAATTLLTEYFAGRSEGHPRESGPYRMTFPDPESFVPPRGVFLIASEDAVEKIQDDAGERSDVGCGGIREVAAGETGGIRFEVKHLYLRPETRGRGIGRALLAELELRARQFGATELVLDTNASLEAAGGLYRSSGFVGIAPYNDNPNATNWYAKML